MLSRRLLRIKAMQALFAYFKSFNNDVKSGEQLLIRSIDNVYELYIYLLSFMVEIKDVAVNRIADNKLKVLPSQSDLIPNTKFIENKLLKQLEDNNQLNTERNRLKLSFSDNMEMIRKIYLNIKETSSYQNYMESENTGYRKDKDYVIGCFINNIVNEELLIEHLEDKKIFFIDDYDLVASMVVKTLRYFKEDSDKNTQLLPLYKNFDEENKFVRELFKKTILYSKSNIELIQKRTHKWESDRIAFMDILLMQMAICEFMYFPSIPIKATLDEYIDISKEYSTDKSSSFINGILDGIIDDLKASDRINKAGRGLIE